MTESSSYFSAIQEYRAEYHKLFLAAFEDGLYLVSKANDSGKYIGTHFNFPSLSFRKNGLPQLSSMTDTGPVNYSGCFSSFSGKPLIEEDKIESFGKLVQYVRSREFLLKRFSLAEETPSMREIEIDKIQILSSVKSSIDRYIHRFNTFEYQAQFVEDAIEPAVSYIFDEKLSIDIYVPILFLDFEIDEHELTDEFSIVRIPDNQHLARYKVNSSNTSAHESVIYAATHALVLKNWYVPNTERLWDFNALSNAGLTL
nr:hypothetical protein [uncultured Methylophaga sp.]